MQETEQTAHGVLHIEDRRRLTVGGVRSVGAATPTSLTCVTGLGELNVKGNELRIQKFSEDEGVLTVQGRIDSAVFTQSKAKLPAWKRLWK